MPSQKNKEKKKKITLNKLLNIYQPDQTTVSIYCVCVCVCVCGGWGAEIKAPKSVRLESLYF